MDVWREPVLLIVLFCLAWLLRRRIVMYPLMLVVTLLHECGHAVAANLTGGGAIWIKVKRNGNGLTQTQNGWPVVIYNGGYLGSMIFGFLFFCLPYTPYGHYTLTIIGVVLVIIIVLWVRDIFTFLFTIGVSAGLMCLGYFLAGGLEMFLAKFIGTCCVLYSWLDMNRYIKNINNAAFLETDAQKLSQITKIPAIFWGTLWRVISVGVLLLMFKLTLNQSTF